MELKEEFHYLKLESAWIEKFIANFATTAYSSTRIDQLHIKNNLHLSLAYKFPS